MVCSPAPTVLANQAPKPFPHAERPQIVDSCEEKQGKYERQAAAERPVLRLRTDRAPLDRFDSVEEEMSTIQHWDWQKVDESEIN